MSRVGKKVIEIPEKVEIKIEGDLITVKGAKGTLSQKIHPNVTIEVAEKELLVKVKDEENHRDRALWGLFRSLINNMVVGVTTGFEKKLEINGVGYKAKMNGKNITLNVGYSHPVEFEIPEGITAGVEQNIVTINGIDKQLVGEVSAMIRRVRKPEPYKGKGIKYSDEVIRRKEGKSSAKSSV